MKTLLLLVNTLKASLITCFLLISFTGLIAQKSFTELVNLSEKKLDKAVYIWGKNEWRPDTKYGCNIDPDLSQVDIKRIALVSFTISIPHSFTEKFLTGQGNKYFANSLYKLSIDDLKQVFKSKGIELLTVENMSPEQKAILDGTQTKDKLVMTNLDLEQGKLLNKYENVEEKGVTAGAAADGYKSWMWLNEGLPLSWDLNVYAAFCELLGVDAILFINNTVDPQSKYLVYKKTIMTLIGPNPIKKIEGKKYPGLSYLHGLPYGQTAISADIEIATFKKKSISSENLEDYGKVITLLADKMLEYIDINTKRSKVKYDKDHR